MSEYMKRGGYDWITQKFEICQRYDLGDHNFKFYADTLPTKMRCLQLRMVADFQTSNFISEQYSRPASLWDHFKLVFRPKWAGLKVRMIQVTVTAEMIHTGFPDRLPIPRFRKEEEEVFI